MRKTTTTERLKKKKVELEQAKKRMTETQAKITKIQKEIAELETFEILNLSKELKIPSSEIRSLIIEVVERKRAAERTEISKQME